MKTYNERTRDILGKAERLKKNQQKKIIAALSGACCFVLIAGLVLFMPYNTQPPPVVQHQKSEYYDLICALNPLTYSKPTDKNNFENWFGDLEEGVNGEVMAPGAALPDGSLNTGVNENDGYVEVTDNQVAGVIEGDRIKRSEKYIYYLQDTAHVQIYSIAKEESALVGVYNLTHLFDEDFGLCSNDIEMFLSSDCTTLTLVMTCFKKEIRNTMVTMVSLDVTDPTKITKIGQLYFTGGYLSARMVQDEILLMSLYRVRRDPDFEDPGDFVPQYGSLDQMQTIPMENILVPEDPSQARYTVISRVDPKTATVKDTAALLSYASEVYVSGETIIASRGFNERNEIEENKFRQVTKTELCGIGYADGKFSFLGNIRVDGSVLNQYSMDIYNGILRVVTTTSESIYHEGARSTSFGVPLTEVFIESTGRGTNANLYCIDLATWQVAASVEQFAPPGESVRSVRFDGDYAYVCTAIQTSDPVFFFDLSDLNNITWKDTGNITGFSSSLVNFGDGYLLGIGYNAEWWLKIEVYEEGENGVESVCLYEQKANFSQDYKAYLIDREKGYIGLGLDDWGSERSDQYLLLQFDGYQLHEVLRMPLRGDVNSKRAVIIDGWIYLLGNEFIAKEL